MVNWSAVGQKDTNCEFSNETEKHEEIIQSLKLNTENSCFDC